MPLYEYCCPHCAEKKEILARTAESAQAPACPACGGPMEKEWAPIACHTKGGSPGCAAPPGRFS
jgi:putative FmdB family regulatory protein